MRLSEQLNDIFKQHGEKPALWVDNEQISYQKLMQNAYNICANINAQTQTIGILSYRDKYYFSATLACTLSENTFVPIGSKLPLARIVSVIEQSNLQQVFFSKKYHDTAAALQELFPDIIFSCLDDIIATACSVNLQTSNVISNNTAYILFTSGSTGIPKGVPISNSNLCYYLTYMKTYLSLTSDDKVSQVFDPTFDLSIHDIFVTWLSGACLYVLPDSALFAPGKFIKDHLLSVWFSVPSTAAIMAKFGMLKPSAYPSLKKSLFCGEAFPIELAKQWQLSAPSSQVISLYGPTEATIACAHCTFDIAKKYHRPFVPIGEAFPHMSLSLEDDGELVIKGPQIFSGYLNNKEKTNEVLQLHNNELYYFSGDLALVDKNGHFHYVSRKDDQVKIQGFRIELSEINTLASDFLSNPLVQTIATPNTQPQNLTLFICDSADKEKEAELIIYLQQKLPAYMVPKKIIWINAMPLNSNGKIDKKALHTLMEKP
ncbi:AMP-binding protein [Pseudoalteromonas mariniglutinosa]|uniref:AMP-binding protein n=1 Tax=Pseudoalteromonas mariniglutinosa TaxID=206042 RepID=UPI00384DD4A6